MKEPQKTQKKKWRRQKPSIKLFEANCWPKVMIPRDDTISKKTIDSSRTYSDVEHLVRDKNVTNFDVKKDICSINSSTEIQQSHELYETLAEKGLKKIESVEENVFDCSLEESMNFETEEKPIFVDLTADEKYTWNATILKRFCDEETSTVDERENGNEKCCENVVLEPRIMIADSSSKLNCSGSGSGSLATALRDRGPCLIPMQPNRSLPIRPAPSVPTRSYRKDCSTSVIVPKSTAMDVIEVESQQSVDTLPNVEVRKERDVNSKEHTTLKQSVCQMDYVVPQISSVGSLVATERRSSDDMEHDKHNVKENRKRKGSCEADSSQNKDEHVGCSIKEFLNNFCGSNATGGIQNLCTDKCVRVTTAGKEENGNKLVPPLRLKKVVPTRKNETEGHNNSQITTGLEHASNYRIIEGTTPRPSSTPTSTNSSDTTCKKDTNVTPLNSDSYKLNYRRNRLKQKLRQLRSKALKLAKQMTNDSNFQQSTGLRQAMNRYEKQIENLSKLHSKLSSTITVSNVAMGINSDSVGNPDKEYPITNLNETSAESSANSPTLSPGPPKLSPRSPLNYDNALPLEIRNSPPILPRVCLAVSPSKDSTEEEQEITERKVTVDEESLRSSSADGAALSVEKNARTESPVQRNSISVESESSGLYVSKAPLNSSEIFARLPESELVTRETRDEKDEATEHFPQCRLMVEEPEKIERLGFPDPGPIISTVNSGVEFQQSETLNICGSSGADIPISKVVSSSVQSTQFNVPERVPSQKHVTSQQSYKEEKISTDSAQGDNYSITEQFPTLGNWLARMSKKQSSRSKPKVQSTGNVPFGTAENTTARSRIPESVTPKIVGPSITKDIINATPQCGTERWQYHHHQQQRQQLLQHVAASVTLSQPVATVSHIRPAICPPIPMTQFYPNNYAIDPYNTAALAYHPALCPYGTYPYHSRLYSSSLPGFHFPIQETLRPMQHVDKRFHPAQDQMIRYPSPSTTAFQHPSNLEFDRLRGNSTTTNIGSASCLPPLFLPSPSLSSHQALTRAPLAGYPTNSQFSRNRMIPDVVAAAAAAAVVAAASFDRQRDTLTYNTDNPEALPTPAVANVIDEEPSRVPGSNQLAVSRDATNKTQDISFKEEGHPQTQNVTFDRLAFVKPADSFAQTNSVVGQDTQAMITSAVSTPYRVPLLSYHGQLSKNVAENEARNCETPDLGKVNRSPNSLYNFTCSNCGIVGPRFKCLGCEMVFYCDERCQEKHWYVHVQRCPKKMPKLKKVT